MYLLKRFRAVLIIISIISCFFACSENQDAKLQAVEDLLDNRNTDSASLVLNQIGYYNLKGDAEKNKYALLRIRLDHQEGEVLESDSIIRQCLKYYASQNDHKNSAECYYYEGQYHYDLGHTKQAFWNMYYADKEAKSTDDISLKHKIKECLLDWSNSAEEYKQALVYGKENYNLSLLSGKKDWIVYSYALMATTYYGLGENYRADELLNKSLMYISSVPRKEQSHFYVSLGSSLIYKSPEKAEAYFNKALAAYPQPSVYSGFCILEFQRGNIEKAEEYFKKALQSKDMSTIEFTYNNMQSLYAASGDYKKAYTTLMDLTILQAKKFKEEKDNNLLIIQKNFENQMKNQEIREMVTKGIIIVILAILAAVSIYFWLHLKNEKWKKDSLQTQLVLNVYKERLEKIKKLKFLDKNDSDSEQEEAKIMKKISEFQDLQSKILYKGKALYQDILDGKNTLTWNKKDFEHFLEYYKLIDLPFITNLQTNYDHLSPRYQFFLVLKKMGKTDEEIQKILAISSTTVRTTKSRIKSSKLD